MIQVGNRPLLSALLIVLVVLAGCSGPGATVSDQPAPLPEPAPVEERETFDVAAYEDQPVSVAREVEHDVPAVLMQNRAGTRAVREVRGYRVQVVSTTDPDESYRLEEAVRSEWQRIARSLDTESQLPRNPSVYRVFKQPYYRIRLGDFQGRATADAVAKLLEPRFPGAFAVPDVVTIR